MPSGAGFRYRTSRENARGATLKISELAKFGGVSVETIRYYQRTGLLAVPARPHFGFRTYSDADAARLLFIRRAQQLGFTLEEIAALLRLSASDCKNVEKLARERLGAVDARIKDLQRVGKVLADVLDVCARRKPYEGCPIIETLTLPSSALAIRSTPSRRHQRSSPRQRL